MGRSRLARRDDALRFLPPIPSVLPDSMGATHGWVCVMSLDVATDLVRQTLLMALLVASPMLGIGLIVGVAISLVQAVTQIQEQTLSFVPKIIAMVGAMILLMPWIGHRLMTFTMALLGSGLHP